MLLYPFTSLLAEFGGCLGLFLGFSFVTISDGIKSIAAALKKNINIFWMSSYFICFARGSYCHPELATSNFFRSHQSSMATLHPRYSSHFSKIKGSHSTHIVATCKPNGHHSAHRQENRHRQLLATTWTAWRQLWDNDVKSNLSYLICELQFLRRAILSRDCTRSK